MTHHSDLKRGRPIPCFLNTGAGSADAVEEALKADERFSVHRGDPEELQAGVRRAIEDGATRIAVAGGDGTVATAAGELTGSGVELAVVPAGTLNHFARSFGISTSVEKALEIAASGESQHVDVGFVNNRIFLNTSSVGAYVDFVHERERHRPALGYYLASGVAAAKVLVRLPTHIVAVASEEGYRHHRTPLVYVGVHQREDENLEIPSRSAGLRLGIVRSRSRWRLIGLTVVAAVRGVDVAAETPHFTSLLVDRCTIKVPAGSAFVAVDGETLLLETPLKYRIQHEALLVVVP